MPHSTSPTRPAPQSPAQLTLLEGIAGWRNTAPQAERQRSRDRERARQRIIDELSAENDRLVAENDFHRAENERLREQNQAEKEILAALREAQDTVITETLAYGKEKRMAFDEVVEALYDLMGTDHPENIAHRLHYSSLDNLITRLQRNGYQKLADELRKPLRKPPAPYPSHMWRTRKPEV